MKAKVSVVRERSLKMKASCGVFLIFLIKVVASGGDSSCGKFKPSILAIVQKFDDASKLLKETSFTLLQNTFNNKTLPIEQKAYRIDELSTQSKQNFDTIENVAYNQLGQLIEKDPKVIARKLLHAFDVTEPPFVCVMKDADYISLTSNTMQRSVTDYANKIIAEL